MSVVSEVSAFGVTSIYYILFSLLRRVSLTTITFLTIVPKPLFCLGFLGESPVRMVRVAQFLGSVVVRVFRRNHALGPAVAPFVGVAPAHAD